MSGDPPSVLSVSDPKAMVVVLATVLALISQAAAALASATQSQALPHSLHTSRRQQRWDAAAATLQATTEARRRFDHRAHLAQLVGIYLGEETPGGVLVAVQPDQGGRKLLFLDMLDGRSLGFVELEMQSAQSESKILQTERARPADAVSALRGMLVAEEYRGRGHARVFLAIWLALCLRAGLRPATTRINKPLLALTLVRLGFTPQRGQRLAALTNEEHLRGAQAQPAKKGKKKTKARQLPLAVEVSVGSEGRVLLYSPLRSEAKRLEDGFSATEVRSQRLVVATEPPEPRGRVAHIRVRYSPPSQGAVRISRPVKAASQLVHVPLADASVGGRFRLSALQGPAAGQPTPDEIADARRILTGLL